MVVKVPVAMNPQIRLVKLKHVVEAFTGSAGNVILEHPFLVNKAGDYTIGALMAHDNLWLYQLINVHNVAKFLVRKLFIVPPVVILSAPIFVDRDSTTDTKNVVAAKC